MSEIPASTPITREQRGRWTRGQSGNPRGRPPRPVDISLLCRERVPEAMAALDKSLKSRIWRERMAAIGIIFDRAFGKPTQPITGADGDSVTFLHLVAMRDIGERIVAELMMQQRGAVIDGTVRPLNGSNETDVVMPPASVGDLATPARE